MSKPLILGTLVCACALGWTVSPGWSGTPGATALLLKEERLTLEYTASSHEAAIVIEAESEAGLGSIEICDPSGAVAFHLRAESGRALALSGFVVETWEGSPEGLLAIYQDGTYEMRGRTIEGRPVRGSAVLSHRLLRAPALVYPFEGAQDVPPNGLEVLWQPDPLAAGYQVILEQNDDDGLTVRLPAGSSSLRVPDGVLLPGTETMVEIAAIAPSGNRTLVEAVFTTR